MYNYKYTTQKGCIMKKVTVYCQPKNLQKTLTTGQFQTPLSYTKDKKHTVKVIVNIPETKYEYEEYQNNEANTFWVQKLMLKDLLVNEINYLCLDKYKSIAFMQPLFFPITLEVEKEII